MSESLKGYVCETSEMEKNDVDGIKKPKYLCYKNRDQADNSYLMWEES